MLQRFLLLFALVLVMTGFFNPARAQISYTDLLAQERPKATHRIAYGREQDQFGDLYLPDGKGKRAVVIMIHGGCWQAELPGVELMAYIAEDLRRRGIAVWNLEYRRLGAAGGGYPGTFLDIADGVDRLKTIAPQYNLDLAHVVALGHSAGGHLALWAAGRGRIAKDSKLYREKPLAIHAAVSLAGINDLAVYRDDGPSCGGSDTIDALTGAASRRDAYADTSPAAMLPLHVKQLVISGAEDGIVPPEFGKSYAEKAKAAGDDVAETTFENAGHFELIQPESDAWKHIEAALLPLLK